jgi:hypothetical protein
LNAGNRKQEVGILESLRNKSGKRKEKQEEDVESRVEKQELRIGLR